MKCRKCNTALVERSRSAYACPKCKDFLVPPTYYLTIAGMVKNESLYVEEWVCFHLLQGVEHFFIYENDSTDKTYKILQKYVDKGIVTLTKIHGLGKQFTMIEKALINHGHKTKWMAVIDCDEFLFADIPLPEFLKDYEDYSALAVHWYNYGSKESEGNLVTERFQFREREVNRHVKSIIQPARTISRGKDSHSFKLVTPAVNENKEELPLHYAVTDPNPTADKIRINHYITKSYPEFLKRKSIARPSTGKVIKNIDQFFKHHDKNEVLDPIKGLLISEVKELMEKYK